LLYQPDEPGWWYGADGMWWPPEAAPAGGYAQPQAQYAQPQYAQPGYAQPQYPTYQDPYAGYWSSKSKVVGGVLQFVLPIGVGRMYLGYVGLGIAQLLVVIFTCGLGVFWCYGDGIYILTSVTHDGDGLPLRS
jgi:hypothetical protein